MPRKYPSLLVLILLIMGLVVYQGTKDRKRGTARAQSLEKSMDKAPGYEADISDDFQGGILSEDLWQLTRGNDFRRSTIDVFNVGKGDLRLRLLADTIGTLDDTVKFHGVRTLHQINFTEGKIISFELDWNNQANGCYLTAGMYLCPTATDTNPRDERDWIACEYVGVPPGKNARFQVARRKKGNLRFLLTEGWPDKQRTGRKVGNQHVELIIDKKGLTVSENGRELFSTEDHRLHFTQAYLYLQMSSHSNYPAREIYFDNINVSSTRK